MCNEEHPLAPFYSGPTILLEDQSLRLKLTFKFGLGLGLVLGSHKAYSSRHPWGHPGYPKGSTALHLHWSFCMTSISLSKCCLNLFSFLETHIRHHCYKPFPAMFFCHTTCTSSGAGLRTSRVILCLQHHCSIWRNTAQLSSFLCQTKCKFNYSLASNPW